MSTVKVAVDSYAILGIARDATVKDINAAYKRLALKLHPDKAGNDDAAIERFQKIQHAVELLRDPSRRHKLDKSLNGKTKRPRSQYPDDNWSTCATEDDSERSSKRERHEFDFDSAQWGRSKPQCTQGSSERHQKRAFNDAFFGKSDQLPKRQRNQQPTPYGYGTDYSYTRYMYSFANSAHMDPNSEESKTRKAQFKADNVQWAQEWAGVDLNVERARVEAREQLRKQKIQAQMVRDVLEQRKRKMEEHSRKMQETLRKAQGQFCYVNPQVNQAIDTHVLEPMSHKLTDTSKPDFLSDLDQQLNGMNGAPFRAKPKDFLGARVECPKQGPKTGKPSGMFNDFMYGRAKELKSAKFKNNRDDPIYIEGNSSPEFLISDTTSNPSATSSGSATSHDSSNLSAGTPSADPFTAHAGLKIQSAADRTIEAHMVGHESTLKPFIPLFKQKLADPSGRYTIDDLASELNGIMLETYNDWLEKVRLSMPDATPITVRNNPAVCSHLGAWKKDYCRPKCNTCSFWMPLFTLTCPGCGLKACIRCKFTGDAFVIDRP